MIHSGVEPVFGKVAGGICGNGKRGVNHRVEPPVNHHLHTIVHVNVLKPICRTKEIS